MARLVQKVELIVQKHQLIINTDHAVTAFVASAAFSITPGREKTAINILSQPHIIFQNNKINMAQNMSDGEQAHDCIKATWAVAKARPDTGSSPLQEAVDLYIDGSCHKTEEGLKAGFAVVRREGQEFQVICSGKVEPPSTQRAELVALEMALERSPGKCVNI